MTTNNLVIIGNDRWEHAATTVDIDDVLNGLYQELSMGYPKFYKMNSLCKVGIIGVERLMQRFKGIVAHADTSRCGTILFNDAASIASDLPHTISVETPEMLPSPANFVYTLPNILNGELAIKFGWTGLNSFFIVNDFEKESPGIIDAIKDMQPLDVLISGLVEADVLKGVYRSELTLSVTETMLK